MNYNNVLFVLMGFWGAIDGYVNVSTPFTTRSMVEDPQAQARTTSLIFVGMLVGNFLTPLFRTNRKKTLIVLMVCLATVLAAEAMTEEVGLYTILKLVEQVIIKLGMTFSFTQLTLTNSRLHITLVGVQFQLGELYAIALLNVNYRASLLVTCLLTLAYLAGYVLLLKDDGRKGKKEEAKVKAALDKKMLVSLSLQSFFLNFIFAGTYYVLARLSLHSDNSARNLLSSPLLVLYSTLSTVPNVFLAAFIIRVLGNANALTAGFACITLFSAAIFFSEDNYLSPLISATRLSLMLSYTFFFSFAGTATPEDQRESMLGLSLGFGRLGSIAMPWVINYLDSEGKFVPFVGFALASFVGVII